MERAKPALDAQSVGRSPRKAPGSAGGRKAEGAYIPRRCLAASDAFAFEFSRTTKKARQVAGFCGGGLGAISGPRASG